MKGRGFWLGASLLGLSWCGVAGAQTAPQPDDRQESAATAPADHVDKAQEDDIIVTAQRRSENLMTTAVSASVLSGSQLANKGVANVDALQFAMPSVVVNNFGQGNDFNIRGIGKAEHNTQTTTGVITYRDGVPAFPGYIQGEPYFDVGNIQVLRGPQGTIVGQNSTGGAVFVNTNDPIINGGVHGYLNVNYGNYNDLGGQGAINLPISDTLAARVSFYGERRDGFFNITGPNGARYNGGNNDLRMIAARFSLLWKPTDRLSILSKTDVDYLNYGAYPATPYWTTFATLPGTATPNPYHSGLFDITANAPMGARDKFVRSILKIDYDTPGGVKFRSVSGFQNANTMYRSDLDGYASDHPNPITGVVANSSFYDSVSETQFSQEFNVISPDSQRLTWLVGAFGLWNTYFFVQPYQFIIDTSYPNDNPLAQYKLQGRNPTRSLAAFGQVGFAITPSLKLEAGGRYTASQSTNHVDVLQYGTYIRADQKVTSDNFSYKVSLGWKASRDQYLYAFVATGFRPGGLNVPVGLGLPDPFKPETITSYEIGWKGNFAGGKIRTTVTGFYNDYKNFQVIIGYPDFPTFGIEMNVPDSTKIYGGEAEIEFRSGGFSFDAGLNILRSELGTFYASDPRAPSMLPCDPYTGPVSVSCINLAGRRQTYAPNFTFNLGAQYEIVIGSKDKIIPRANFGHVGSQWATLFQTPSLGDRLGDRNILNAQLAWEHESWTVTGYATNLTNQHYVGALNSNLYFPGAPRQYGVKVMRVF